MGSWWSFIWSCQVCLEINIHANFLLSIPFFVLLATLFALITIHNFHAGVEDASAIHFSLGEDSCTVEVPGNFPATDFSLGCLVDREPLTLRFIRKKKMLKVLLKVAGGPPSPPGSPPPELCSDAEDEEGEDLDMYAFARQQANKESAETAFQHAQDAITQADYDRAVRLMKKALQLDPTNGAYQGALKIAIAAAASAQRPAPAPAPTPQAAPTPEATPTPVTPPPAPQTSDEGDSQPKKKKKTPQKQQQQQKKKQEAPRTPSAPMQQEAPPRRKTPPAPAPTPGAAAPSSSSFAEPEEAVAELSADETTSKVLWKSLLYFFFAIWLMRISPVVQNPATCPGWLSTACDLAPWLSYFYTQLWAAPSANFLAGTHLFTRKYL